MNKENIYQWTAFLSGPDDSPFKDSFFELNITLDDEYPVGPPKIR